MTLPPKVSAINAKSYTSRTCAAIESVRRFLRALSRSVERWQRRDCELMFGSLWSEELERINRERELARLDMFFRRAWIATIAGCVIAYLSLGYVVIRFVMRFF